MNIVLAYLCFRHAVENYGLWRASLFLTGSFFFTGLEESMWILLGRFSGVQGTYYFTKGFLWFIETPVQACLAWFFIAYSSIYIASIIMKRRGSIWKASLGGFIAMDIDLWLDPVQTAQEWRSWVWLSQDRINIFSIPLSNFIGWFLLIFLFAIVYEKVLPSRPGSETVRTAGVFFSVLFLLEMAIFAFFIVYGTIALALIPDNINITIGGI